MERVLSCVGGEDDWETACDASIWLSRVLEAELYFVHMLKRASVPVDKMDYSGRLGANTSEELLRTFTCHDERSNHSLLEAGLGLLKRSCARALAEGCVPHYALKLSVDFVETVLAQMSEPSSARALVLGSSAHLISEHAGLRGAVGLIESLVKSVRCPVLIARKPFQAPTGFMVAFDASKTAERIIDWLLVTEGLWGLPCHLVMVRQSMEDRSAFELACSRLTTCYAKVEAVCISGDTLQSLQRYQQKHALGLVVMGSTVHSRLWHLWHKSQMLQMHLVHDASLLLFNADVDLEPAVR